MTGNLPKSHATLDELVSALELLSESDRLRLARHGNVLCLGTEYAQGQELLNEAIQRALIGASGTGLPGKSGRHWPTNIALAAFLTMTMKGLASDSHRSLEHQLYRTAAKLTKDGQDGRIDENPKLLTSGLMHPSVEDELIAFCDAEERDRNVDADVRRLEAEFSGSQDVQAIIEGEKDGMSAQETRETFDMTSTQYDSARKRLRRGADKMFPGRRKP